VTDSGEQYNNRVTASLKEGDCGYHLSSYDVRHISLEKSSLRSMSIFRMLYLLKSNDLSLTSSDMIKSVAVIGTDKQVL
jgi:hypothetical protein